MTRDELAEAAGYVLLAEAVADVKYAGTEAPPGQVRAYYDRRRDDLYTTVASYRLGKITVPGKKLAERALGACAAAQAFGPWPDATAWTSRPGIRAGSSVGSLRSPCRGSWPARVRRAASQSRWSSGKWQVFRVVACVRRVLSPSQRRATLSPRS